MRYPLGVNGLVLAILVALGLAWPAAAAATSSQAEIETSTAKGVTYLKSLQETNGSIPGFGGDWSLTSLAAAGTAAERQEDRSLDQCPDVVPGTGGRHDDLAGIEQSPRDGIREAALVAYAAGIDPARVSQTQNLIAQGSRAQTSNPGYYGEPSVFEGTLFGLLALAGTMTREGVQRVPQVLLEQSVAVVRANQHTDGGWNFEKVEGSEEGLNLPQKSTRPARRWQLSAVPACRARTARSSEARNSSSHN